MGLDGIDLQGVDLGIDGLSAGAEIGVGASALVYRATQEGLDREVAVKVLNVSDPDFTRRFQREARVLGKLSRNPGVVTIYDTGITSSGRPYLILELCQSSLLEQLRSGGPFDPPEACRIIGEVAGAVSAAHDLGVIHRDLKPANVLQTEDGRYLVTDFGISVVSGATAGQTNSVGFTAGYVAPETVSGGTAGPAADVYALGASLFQLITGETAFTDPTGDSNLMALVNRITHEAVPDLRGRGVPEDVCFAIEWAMVKDPTVRPTAAQLQETLRCVTSGLPIPAPYRQSMENWQATDTTPDSPTAANVTGEIEAVAASGDFAGQLDKTPEAPLSNGVKGIGSVNGIADAAGSNPSVASLGSTSGPVGRVGPDTPTLYTQPGDGRQRDGRRRLIFRSVALLALLAVVVSAGVIVANVVGGGDDDGSVATSADVDSAGAAGADGSGSGLFTPSNDPAGPPEVASGMGRLAPVTVPSLRGMTREEAETELTEAGLSAHIVLRANPTGPFEVVVDQDPSAGSRVPGQFSVNVIVSVREAPDEVDVPVVAGSTVEAATTALSEAGLVVIEPAQEIYHDTVPAGQVAGTTPPGGSPINVGTEVTLFVSLGQPTMPDVVGKTRDEALALLQALSLTGRIVTEPSETVGEGLVISSPIESGTVVPTGSEVELVVSLGSVALPCELPTVRGMTEADARSALSTAGCPEPRLVEVVDAAVAIGRVAAVAFDEADPPVPVLQVSSPDCAAVAAAQIGELEVAARSAVVDAGCSVGAVTEVIRAEDAEGTVVAASADGRTINLMVAITQFTCTIPDVAGQTVAVATATITAAGCEVVSAGSAPQDAIVTGTEPFAGSVVNTESSISLVVETGSAPCDFGSLVGMTRATAVDAVTSSGCTASVVEVELEQDDPDIGLVIGHDPGPVAAGTTVEIRVGVEPTTTSTTGATVTTPTTGGSDPGSE